MGCHSLYVVYHWRYGGLLQIPSGLHRRYGGAIAFVWAVSASMWDITASMWDIVASVWALTASLWAVTCPDSTAVKCKKMKDKMEKSGIMRKILAPVGVSHGALLIIHMD